jgi:hypothetical protein
MDVPLIILQGDTTAKRFLLASRNLGPMRGLYLEWR